MIDATSLCPYLPRVQAELEQLLVLQDRQQKIKQVQTEIRALPVQRKNLEAQLAANAAALTDMKQKVQQLEVDRKRLELDAGTRQESIARLKTQQYETRKNDEFQAMGHEIERYEREIQSIEDQELELMDQADKVRTGQQHTVIVIHEDSRVVRDGKQNPAT